MNNRIRMITPAGVVTSLTNGTSGNLDGSISTAEVSGPYDVAFDASGNPCHARVESVVGLPK